MGGEGKDGGGEAKKDGRQGKKGRGGEDGREGKKGVVEENFLQKKKLLRKILQIRFRGRDEKRMRRRDRCKKQIEIVKRQNVTKMK